MFVAARSSGLAVLRLHLDERLVRLRLRGRAHAAHARGGRSLRDDDFTRLVRVRLDLDEVAGPVELERCRLRRGSRGLRRAWRGRLDSRYGRRLRCRLENGLGCAFENRLGSELRRTLGDGLGSRFRCTFDDGLHLVCGRTFHHRRSRLRLLTHLLVLRYRHGRRVGFPIRGLRTDVLGGRGLCLV